MKPRIALFRGINVGGRNKLPMRDLAALLEGIGVRNVHTYIQSGNVVFLGADDEDPGLGARIEDAIEERYGFRPQVTILDAAGLELAISGNPFPEADGEPSTVHLTFLSALPVEPDLQALERIREPSERFALKGRVFFLHAPEGIGRSRLAARIERSLGVSGTARNWRTVLKLQEMIRACA